MSGSNLSRYESISRLRGVGSWRLLPLEVLASQSEPSLILSLLFSASGGSCYASAWYLFFRAVPLLDDIRVR